MPATEQEDSTLRVSFRSYATALLLPMVASLLLYEPGGKLLDGRSEPAGLALAILLPLR